MSRRWRGLLIAVGVLVLGVVLFPFAFTVVPIEEQEQIQQSDQFDAQAFVSESWDEITAAIHENAVDLAVVLSGFQPDQNGNAPKDQLEAVAEEHGLITEGEAHVYSVSFTGEVVSVDIESSVGTIQVAIDGYAGPVVVDVLVGPRLPSDDSSIRDAVGFISFGDFRDQTEYGRVSSEINARVRDDVLADIDPESLIGQQVTVHGALTIRTFNLISIDVSRVKLVPVSIQVA